METNTVVVNGNQPSSRYGLGYHVLQSGYCLGHHVLHHLGHHVLQCQYCLGRHVLNVNTVLYIMCYNVDTVLDIMCYNVNTVLDIMCCNVDTILDIMCHNVDMQRGYRAKIDNFACDILACLISCLITEWQHIFSEAMSS